MDGDFIRTVYHAIDDICDGVAAKFQESDEDEFAVSGDSDAVGAGNPTFRQYTAKRGSRW
jgi:hypothetical protein